jgi:hypothetical protein
LFTAEKLMLPHLGNNKARVEEDAVGSQSTRMLQNHHGESPRCVDALHLDVREDVPRKDGSIGLDLVTAVEVEGVPIRIFRLAWILKALPIVKRHASFALVPE